MKSVGWDFYSFMWVVSYSKSWAALTFRTLGQRFTFDCGVDHFAMHKNHIGQAAAKCSDQSPEQEFADLLADSIISAAILMCRHQLYKQTPIIELVRYYTIKTR